jgi:hypothetical protein
MKTNKIKEDKCSACGKKKKLICPYEWTNRDERAFNLGSKEATADLIKRVLEIHRRLSDKISSWHYYCKCFERELNQMVDEK